MGGIQADRLMYPRHVIPAPRRVGRDAEQHFRHRRPPARRRKAEDVMQVGEGPGVIGAALLGDVGEFLPTLPAHRDAVGFKPP